jgi:hypothetical protein
MKRHSHDSHVQVEEPSAASTAGVSLCLVLPLAFSATDAQELGVRCPIVYRVARNRDCTISMFQNFSFSQTNSMGTGS